MKKKSTWVILMIAVLLAIFSIGAMSVNKIKISLGENVPVQVINENAIDLRIPCNIPLEIDFTMLHPGCGSSLPDKFKLEVEAIAVIHYDKDTGENWLRFEKVQYQIDFGKKNPELIKLK